jgi:hypothetical protein
MKLEILMKAELLMKNVSLVEMNGRDPNLKILGRRFGVADYFIFLSFAFFSVSVLSYADASISSQPNAAPDSVRVTKCSRADAASGLPARIDFKVLNESQIEAWAWNEKGQMSASSRFDASELTSQPGLAMFNVGGQLMVSGDAKLLITKAALKYRNVGLLLFTNRTSGEISSYHCQYR